MSYHSLRVKGSTLLRHRTSRHGQKGMECHGTVKARSEYGQGTAKAWSRHRQGMVKQGKVKTWSKHGPKRSQLTPYVLHDTAV